MSDQSKAPNNPTGAPESVASARAPAAPKKKSESDSWFELAKTIFYAGLIALTIRTTLFQPFNIPSQSMEATLLVGDYLFVEKFAYGYSRFSLPFGKYFPSVGRVFGSEPTPGDVIVFKYPHDDSTDYIKRLVGLPGDRVQMVDGALYINGKPVQRTRVDDYVEQVGDYANRVPQYRETLPNGVSYLTLDRESYGPNDNTVVFTVPAGHYFMMGDNRDNSSDSRISTEAGGVGFIPYENLVGKAQVRFFSIDGSGTWYMPWTWPTSIRFSRMFTLIR